MKKIAAIHDLSGYGRASLTVAIPILTHMGFQVCPLPTAILSAHSEYKDFRSLDLTDYMESFIAHWKELQLQFDAIYTGYLASVKQMGIVSDFFAHFKNGQNFILVDPVTSSAPVSVTIEISAVLSINVPALLVIPTVLQPFRNNRFFQPTEEYLGHRLYEVRCSRCRL